MNFGQNLKRLRLSKNLTQEQVAQKFNITTQTISRWECSSTYPDVLLLPELSKLYGVTIDDLFKEESISYENYAHRLLSVYEETQKFEDFLRADNEFQKLIQSGKYSSKDICMYGILYQNLMMTARNKAESVFKKGLDENIDEDIETKQWIKRQYILLLSQTGRNNENIETYLSEIKLNPDDQYAYINIVFSYLLDGKPQEALNWFEKGVKKCADSYLLYFYGGNAYKDINDFETAIKYYKKAWELDQSFTMVLRTLASCYEEINDYKNALETWCETKKWLESHGYFIEANSIDENIKRCKK